MIDRPIIFSAPMILALLEGRKTMTRRLAWRVEPCPQHCCPFREPRRLIELEGKTCESCPRWNNEGAGVPSPWQKLQRGDRLWVREAFKLVGGGDPGTPIYRANWREDAQARGLDNIPTEEPKGWRPSIHMPRWASRLTLEVIATRVELLQAIDQEDAKREGVRLQYSEEGHALIVVGPGPSPLSYSGGPRRPDETSDDCISRAWTFRAHFGALWDSLHGVGAWNQNPAVVVISFHVWLYNIDLPQTARPLLARAV